MKKFLIPTLAIGAALSFVACQSDELLVGGNGMNGEEGDGRYAYINATIALPSNLSRSSTEENDPAGDGDDRTNSNGSSNSGFDDTDNKNEGVVSGPDFEVGHDFENDVRSMILVITDNQDRYLTHLVINGLAQSSTNGTYEITSRIPYRTLEEAYGENGLFREFAQVKPMRLYAFCNYTNNMLTQFNDYQVAVTEKSPEERENSEYLTYGDMLTAWRDFHGSVEEKASLAGQTPQSTASIWSPRSFMMSSFSVYETTFPETLDDWNQYADDRNPLDLTEENGPIDVERVSARIDFRDASEDGDQTYRIWTKSALFSDAAAADAEGVGVNNHEGEVNLYSVHLSRMVLVNMSKNFYYLRRVSGDGTMTNPQYAGKERKTNYVVDFDFEAKASNTINASNEGDYFNFPLYSGETDAFGNFTYNNMGSTYGWYISNISDVLAGTEDNWNPTVKPDNYSSYVTWRYVTENTIPGVEAQQTKQSTGIIFKASIEVGDDVNETFTLNQQTGAKERFVSQAVVNALRTLENHPTTRPDAVLNFFDEQGEMQKTGTAFTDSDDHSLPAIYSFQSTLYAGVPDIVAGAKRDGNGGALYFAVDQILKNWYLATDGETFATEDIPAGFESDPYYTGLVGKYVFKYMPENNKKADVEGYRQLNVVIADMILNDTEATDGQYDFSKSHNTDNVEFAIDFRNADAPANLADFNNSQFIEDATDMNITTFIPTNDDTEGWGYYCYYFYWIRHNDNGLNGKMGPMEFATVRNNVYKLAVTGISAIGHPRDTTRDPDPVQPDDPDEEEERSIKVEVNVLPWVVRVNNIEF